MRNLWIGGLLILSATACDSMWTTETPVADPASLVAQVWNEVNEHYVFFDQKPVDWETALGRYQEQVSPEMSEEALFEVLSNMLRELEDGHVSLQAGFNTFKYHEVYLNFQSNYQPGVVEREYLDRQINELGPFVYSLLDGDVGYLRYGSFADDFTQEQLVYLMDYFADTRSIIIDVRDNLGGSAGNVKGLMALFITETQTVGQQHMPDGTGGYVVSDITVAPNEQIDAYQNPVIVLTNRKSYSSANVFPGFMSLLPQVTVMGDTTAGGTGLAIAKELSNGWKFRYSSAKITLADGTEFENGFAPDVVVTTDFNDAAAGIDAILDAAIAQ